MEKYGDADISAFPFEASLSSAHFIVELSIKWANKCFQWRDKTAEMVHRTIKANYGLCFAK